jgi:hypothetical protein
VRALTAERRASRSDRIISTVPSPALAARSRCRPAPPGRPRGVQVVGLALASPGGTVRPVHLDTQLTVGAQPAREPGAVAAGGFHADAIHRPQPPRPAKQRSVAARVGGIVRVPSGRPAWSSAAATWRSAWVSTPRVTSTCGCGRVGRATVSALLVGVGGTHQPDGGQHCDGPVGQAPIGSLRQTGGAEDARPDRPTDPIPVPGSKASGSQGSDRQGGRLDHHPRSGTRLSLDPPLGDVVDRVVQVAG